MKGIYTHQVQYYETDKMGIVHHSNYIRWFEEARSYGIRADGFGYERLEAMGILIPVLSASCEYKAPAYFGQTVQIEYELFFFDGVRFGMSYRVASTDGSSGACTLHAIGETRHCFLDSRFRVMNIRKYAPEVYEYFRVPGKTRDPRRPKPKRGSAE